MDMEQQRMKVIVRRRRSGTTLRSINSEMSVLRRIAFNIKDFGEHTSAHGIPRACGSHGFRRALWFLVLLCCAAAFSMQAYLIVERFLRNDIIVGVELRFERIAFPAVTVCNLNPYKNSLARELGSMQETLRAFEDAIEQSSEDMKPQRRKRSTSINTITTRCTIEHDTHLVADPHGTLYCTCLSHGSLTWFCRKDTEWRDSFCSECNHETGTCIESIKYPNFPCKCHTDFCATIDHHLIRARWPLELSIMACKCKGSFCEATSVSGESGPEICHCISHSSSKPLCAAASRWQYAKCGHCLWNGQCMRSDDRNYEMDCLCIGDSMSKCFAVEDVNDDYERDVDLHRALRVRRENRRFYEKTERNSDLLAVFASCECPTNDTCKAIRENINSTNLCLCFYNKKNDVVWPCYPTDMWIEKRCKSCSFLGDCMYMEISGNIPCVCAPIIRMCVRIDGTNGGDSNWNDTFATSKITDSLSRRLVKIWEITTTTTPSLSAAKKEKLDKAFGLAGMNDPVAIKAKTTENLIYAANNLNTTEKEAISYRKEEFITKCSFNGRQCSIEEDFTMYVDPSFGNCFTFNSNKTKNKTSERAGPAYGLRFQVFVNVSDYLPSTEAAGVRLTIHNSDEQPFPDTHGYSAPTGFASSFGIRMKHMMRLPSPYGNCQMSGKNEDFIYRDKNYSTEGCQRSCIQKYLTKKCGCGDPRFPPYKNTSNCPADDPELRECVQKELTFATRFIDKIGCVCRQPCRQLVYSVSFSASRWPAGIAAITDCLPGLTPQQCLNFYREQGAFIEVFYEQLNYESLHESEAYGLPNLLSDFGGQLGLWMGVSVITIMEVGILLMDVLFTLLCCHGMSDKKKDEKTEAQATKNSHRSSVPSRLVNGSSREYGSHVTHYIDMQDLHAYVPTLKR